MKYFIELSLEREDIFFDARMAYLNQKDLHYFGFSCRENVVDFLKLMLLCLNGRDFDVETVTEFLKKTIAEVEIQEDSFECYYLTGNNEVLIDLSIMDDVDYEATKEIRKRIEREKISAIQATIESLDKLDDY
jgi:hypothetical protein